MILEEGVQNAAAILRQAEELSGDTQMAIPEHLKQPHSEQNAAHGRDDNGQRSGVPSESGRSARREESGTDSERRRPDAGQRAGGVAQDPRRQLLVDLQHRQRSAALHQPSKAWR